MHDWGNLFLITRWYTSPYNPSQHTGNGLTRIWSLTHRAFRRSASRTSRPTGGALKYIVGPAVLTVSARLFCPLAHCKADINNNTPLEVAAKNPVPEFKWHILWEFVKPQLFALIGAIVVRKISSLNGNVTISLIKCDMLCAKNNGMWFILIKQIFFFPSLLLVQLS